MNTFELIFIVANLALLLVIVIKSYLKFTTRFCTSQRRLDGKVALVTGSNAGIGLEVAKDLARRGAKVILGCRDTRSAEHAADEIKRETKNRNVIVKKLDLSSLTQIRSFCHEILEDESKLDILVNNAGASFTEKLMTEDGIESHMAINHLGPFLLTNMLLGLMLKSGSNCRIVNTSSIAHLWVKSLDLENLNSEKLWEPRQIYGKTKLYNVLFTTELHRRIRNAGLLKNISVNSVHPGFVRTSLFRHAKKIRIYNYLFKFFEIFAKTTWEGAQTTIQVAVSEELDGISGLYWANCKNALMNELGEDEKLAKDLWDLSAKMVKLQSHEYHLPL